jgi:hypothetical protein
MLEFPIQVYEKTFDPKAYGPSFRSPILFFLSDKADPRSVLTAFAWCDFAAGRIKYITSYSPENAAALERELTPSLEPYFSVLRRNVFRQVHGAIEIVPDESFLAFTFETFRSGFFYHVDCRRKRMRLVTVEDFQRLSGSGPVDSFGSTFYKDPEDPRFFYLNAKLAPAVHTGRTAGEALPRIAYYRVSLDLTSATLLYSRTCPADEECPHVTRRIGDYLLSSEFNVTEYQLTKSGRTFRTDRAFYDHVIHDYWSRLRGGARLRAVAARIVAHPFAFLKTLRRQKRMRQKAGDRRLEAGGTVQEAAPPASSLQPPVSSLQRTLRETAADCCFRGTHPSRHFIWACLASEEYAFRLAPGSIRVLSLPSRHGRAVPGADPAPPRQEEGREEAAFTVRHSKPAHFEVGRDGDVYLSCHTFFAYNGRSYFIEPAAILKLRVTRTGLSERGVFRHPTGYRLASHVVLESGGREYLCTVGQPNRLFLVDAESMEAVAWTDIGTDHLSKAGDIGKHLSHTNLEAEAARALSASEDGKYVVLAGGTGVAVVDLGPPDRQAGLPDRQAGLPDRQAGPPAGLKDGQGSMTVIDTLPVAAWLCRLAGRTEGEILCEALHCQRMR